VLTNRARGIIVQAVYGKTRMPPNTGIREAALNKTERVRSRLDGLARRYYAPLASFFRKRTRNASEVQDLVQQVFLRLARSRDVGELRNPEGYIFQTAANTLRDHYRRAAVRHRFLAQEMASPSAADSDFSAERVILGKESLARLAAALHQLPERTRDVLMLRCFEGLKNAEIADLQRISVRSVEKHMAKALAHLSLSLEGESGEKS
jgi:RNA polymerase sigma factor (sigma-70 family)